MSGFLNASEIVEFALYIEQKGYQFYIESAKKLNDPKLLDLFNILAEEELRHEHIFKRLQKDVGFFIPEESYEGEYQNYMKEYLKTISPTTNEKMIQLVKRINSVEEAIDMALGFEKDSVVFYNLLINFVNGESKKTVENIIQEEIKHVLKLNNYKTNYTAEIPDVDAL